MPYLINARFEQKAQLHTPESSNCYCKVRKHVTCDWDEQSFKSSILLSEPAHMPSATLEGCPSNFYNTNFPHVFNSILKNTCTASALINSRPSILLERVGRFGNLVFWKHDGSKCDAPCQPHRWQAWPFHPAVPPVPSQAPPGQQPDLETHQRLFWPVSDASPNSHLFNSLPS